MVRAPLSRPPVGWLVAIVVVCMHLFVAFMAAGFLTVAVVATLEPPEAIWVGLLVTLSLAFTRLGLRNYSPEWYTWLRGRPARRSDQGKPE